ncbi:MAG: response regulator [Myxococcales bacterium]|nr:response regulator [Myxococcales bacterium]
MPKGSSQRLLAPSDMAMHQRLLEEGWEAEARTDRWLAGLGGAALLLAWTSDLALLGVTGLAFVLLGLRVTGFAMLIPVLLGALAPRPPKWLWLARLSFLATSVPVCLIIVLHPTTLAVDGWGMVAMWTLLAFGVSAPLLSKVLVLGATYAVFLVHLGHMMAERGDAYGNPSQVVTIVICGALAVLLVPWLGQRSNEHRLRELATRLRLEHEVELREAREQQARAAEARADQAATQARQAARQAQEEARLRTELFANMSHDLRTPMAGILGIVELMQDTPLTEEQAGFLATIRASNQTLLSLLDDVIDFTRIEEGKLPIAAVTVPLGETLRRPADLLRVTAERKELGLNVELDPELPRYAELDPARVQQILLNLLGNAVKFTQHGSVTLRASARSHEDQEILRVEVQDTGIGFTEAQEQRLFRRFTQADDRTVHRFGGSGLGLSICQGLVSLMGGRIGAQRRAEGGSVFWFEIPLRPSQAPPDQEQERPLPRLSVLLAEDNAVNQLVLSTMLQKLGQSVAVANDGQQALRLLQQQRFDLAIIDMQMPVMDGAELTTRVRQAAEPMASTRIVALTATAEPERHAEFRACGVDAVYTKPIDLVRLRRLLETEAVDAHPG